MGWGRKGELVWVTAASLLLAVSSADAQNEPTPGQRLAVQTKPSVVRVIAGYEVEVPSRNGVRKRFHGGHGSGFFVDPSGYIATNAHVVRLVHLGKEKAREQIVKRIISRIVKDARLDRNSLRSSGYSRVLDRIRRQVRIIKKVAVVILPNGDKLPYDIKAYGVPVNVDSAKDVAILKVQTTNAPTLLIGDDAKVQIQDRLFAFGYPGAADDLGALLDKASKLEATITDGTVSAKKKSKDGVPVLQVTTNISPGNSGGPVVNQKGLVVGLATFGHRRRAGYNFLVPASTVKEFVRQAGAANKRSITNDAFDEGLKLHWDRRYTAAIKKFEEVKTLFASHSEAPKFIAEALELKRSGKERKKSESDNSVILIIVFSSLFAAGVIVLIVVMRKRGAPPAHHYPPGMQPQMAHAGPPAQRHVPPSAPHQVRGAPSQPHQAPQSGPHGPPPAQPSGPNTPTMQTPPGQPPPGQPQHQTPPPQQTPGRASASQPVARTIAVSPAASGMKLAGLACVRGLLHGQHFEIGPHGVVVGREQSQAQIVINDGRVSGKHAWIGFQDGKLVVIDQGSTNGIFVNEMSRGRVTQVELRHGDTVIVSEPDVCSLTVMLGPSGGATNKTLAI